MVIPLSNVNKTVESITVTVNSGRNGASGVFLVIQNPDGSFRTNPEYVNLCPHSVDSGMVPKNFTHTYSGAFVQDLSCCTLLMVVQLYRFPNQSVKISSVVIQPNIPTESFRSLENFASSNNTNKWYIMPLVIIFILLSLLLAFCNFYPKLCKRNKFFKFFILKKTRK